MIDDLAIANDRIASVGAGDRLMAAFDVDNAEAAHSESEVAVDEKAGIIGAALDQPVTLPSDDASVDPTSGPPVPASNSAHN
jgi:hypothetical protein